MLRMLNSARIPSEQLRLNTELKQIYGSCGNIRNLQLHHNYVQEWCNKNAIELPRTYLSYIANEVAVNLSHLQGLLSTPPAHILKRSFHDYKPFIFEMKDRLVYIQNQTHLVLICIKQSDLPDDEMHRLRKLFKDFGYNRKYLVNGDDPHLPDFFSNKEQIDSFTDMLGSYHDLCVYAQFLQFPFVPGGVPDKEELTLRNIAEGLQKQHNDFSKKLKQIIPTLFDK